MTMEKGQAMWKRSAIVIAACLTFACGTSDAPQAGEVQKTASDAGHAQDASKERDVDQRALMSRWNNAVDVVKTPIDFHWSSVDEFPHPTFRGMGRMEAYEQYASVLLRFLQDNADYLASEHLFQTELLYLFPSGDEGLRTTFQELAAEFSSTRNGDIPAQTREELAGFADRK
jgi:hypothetical protein